MLPQIGLFGGKGRLGLRAAIAPARLMGSIILTDYSIAPDPLSQALKKAHQRSLLKIEIARSSIEITKKISVANDFE